MSCPSNAPAIDRFPQPGLSGHPRKSDAFDPVRGKAGLFTGYHFHGSYQHLEALQECRVVGPTATNDNFFNLARAPVGTLRNCACRKLQQC